jgi:hypothetical protein
VASSALATSAAVTGGAAAGKASTLGIAKAVSFAKLVGIVGVAGMGAMASVVVFREVHDARSAHVELRAAPGAQGGPTGQVHAEATSTLPADEGWTPAPIDPLTIPVDPLTIASTAPNVVPPAPMPAQTPTVVADAGELSASTVPGELKMLELAREGLLAGDPALCLSILDRYTRQFPRGRMAPEGTRLRIEALMNAGDRSAARQIADAYLADDPDGPYAARVRSLVQVANP